MCNCEVVIVPTTSTCVKMYFLCDLIQFDLIFKSICRDKVMQLHNCHNGYSYHTEGHTERKSCFTMEC